MKNLNTVKVLFNNNKKLFTRQQVLNNECTHREYYSQFVTEVYKNSIKIYIGLKKLLTSKDPHLNDIPLAIWDNAPLTTGVAQQMKELGDCLTLAGKVCVAKEATKQVIEEYSLVGV